MQPGVMVILAGSVLAAPLCHGQAVVGKPCLFSDYFAEWRTFPAILRSPDGNLSCGGNLLNRGGATPGPRAAGSPCATATRRTDRFGPQCHFTYRDAAGNLQDLWFDRHREKDRWHVEQLTNGGATWAPVAAGEPSGAVFREDFHVVYRDVAGGVRDVWSDGAWHERRLNQGDATDAPAAAGDPVQLLQSGRRQVFYRDLAGGLQDLWFDGAWHVARVNHGGHTDAPGAAGEPAPMRVRSVLHIAYRDVQGDIQNVSYDGAWHAQRLTGQGATDALQAQGDPCVWAAGTTPHVAYRDILGNLQDLSCQDGAWLVRQLNHGGATGGLPAASDPVALVPPSGWEYLAYVDIAGNAQLLSRFQDNPWRLTCLNVPGRGQGRDGLPASLNNMNSECKFVQPPQVE